MQICRSIITSGDATTSIFIQHLKLLKEQYVEPLSSYLVKSVLGLDLKLKVQDSTWDFSAKT